jgi:myosin heavy subunit
MQLNASETRLQELARRNQEVSDCYERVETEVADLRRWPKDSQSKDREIEIARQQLAIVQSREIIYREQQQQLEARIVDLERELSEGKNHVQVLDDTRQRLRETERVCWELAEENRRLWEQASLWQERLAASAESQREVSILRQQIDELQTEHARLINGKRQAQEEFTASGESIAVSRLVADCNGPEVIQTTTNAGAELSLVPGRLSGAKVHKRLPSAIAISETKSLHNRSQETRGDQSHLSSGDLVSATHMEKEEEASWVVWTSVKRQWRFGAVAATVVVIAGAVAMGIRGTKLSASKEAAVAPETSFQEYTVEAVSKPQKNSAPRLRDTFETVQPTRINSGPTENSARRLRGTFETVQPTRLYSGPSEDSALIADIGAGMKVNVVDSSYGWLEIRSKHGRPPGFIRQEAAVRIAWN